MRTVLACSALLIAIGFVPARPDDPAKGHSDAAFVEKASEAGMAEVDMGRLASKQATSAEVREFAQRMVKDHTKANKELMKLADKKRFKVSRSMDDDHRKAMTKLAKLSGAEFDREYMAGQVKDHELAVTLFEKQGKGGKDEDLSAWASKTLPHLQEHLKMAQEIHGKLKTGGKRGGR